jgi:hypothetical protein
MTHLAPRHVAIWIDSQGSLLLVLGAGKAGTPLPGSAGGEWLQHRVDRGSHGEVQGYYDAVLDLLLPQDEILILGPGGAKRELRRRIKESGGRRGRVVGLRQASDLTRVELVLPTHSVDHPEHGEQARTDGQAPRLDGRLLEKPEMLG